MTEILLKDKTFYGLGGVIDQLVESDDLGEITTKWVEAHQTKKPTLVLGKGANIACHDEGFRGVVFIPQNKNIYHNPTTDIFTVGAGANWQILVDFTTKLGFEDLCPLSGIPGNIGGFIRGNAGAYEAETGDFVRTVRAINTDGKLVTFDVKQCDFEYRGSFFKQHPEYLIWEVDFALGQKTNPDKAQKQAKDLLMARWKKYPAGRSGGCVFKNPDPDQGILAGQILDKLGAKKDQIGDIMVSQEHANFMSNLGQGTQSELIELIKKWQKKVWLEKQIILEPEIQIIDPLGQRRVLSLVE